tara:strand:- start:511 stop:705 length:195 start_codon:yes stop_codon:yes gene_type:complete
MHRLEYALATLGQSLENTDENLADLVTRLASDSSRYQPPGDDDQGISETLVKKIEALNSNKTEK